MKAFRKIAALFMVCAMLTALCAASVAAADMTKRATILFTHDLHSHFLPVDTDDGGESGGYARLASLLKSEREKYADTAVITVDGGDFSMGSLFQTIFTTTGAELRVLGAMQYDATTFGNHEFDFRQKGLAAMLDACAEARAAGETLPEVLDTNYWPDKSGDAGYTPDDDIARAAFENFGVKEYTIIERNGVKFAIFAVIGADAHGDSPLSGMKFEEPADAAKRVLAEIEADGGADYVICLSHSGTASDPTADGSEDYELAKAVSGIDVIISGHTHSTLSLPVCINDTVIVSCGSYAANLGVLRLARDSQGKVSLQGYELIPVDETVPDDAKMESVIAEYKELVAGDYLADFEGMTGFDTPIAHIGFDLDHAYGKIEDKALGNLITEGYIYAMENYAADGYDPVDIAVVPCGVIRGSLTEGDVTVSEAFDVLSLGVGADGTAGYPLVSIYMTGKEVRTGMEVDASLAQFLDIAQLYMTGVNWEWNGNRMLMNRVSDAHLVRADGSLEEIDDEKLYHIVTGQNFCQMLGKVTSLTKGLISFHPKDRDGNLIDDGGTYDTAIVYKEDGSELKEWYSFASYLESFDDTDGDGLADVPDSYRTPKGNKTRVDSWNPVRLFKNINIYTIIVLVLAAVIILVIVLIIRKIVRGIRRKKKKA